MSRIKLLFIIIVLFIALKPLTAQVEGDKIIAIVGNEIITQSDVSAQITMYISQYNITQVTEKLYMDVLNNMINEKLLLAKAEQDSIQVTEDEVQKQVDFRVQQLIKEAGSEKNLEELYGITLVKIKSILTDDFRKSTKVNKLKQEKFGYELKVTRQEVEDFYTTHKDSLLPVPEAFDIYSISKIPDISEDTKNSTLARANLILDSLKTGGDFTEIARRNSDDSASAKQGGLLGKVKKGDLFRELEAPVYLLKVGDLSEPLESQFGYHIFKLLDKKGEILSLQHILIKFPKTPSSDFEAINFLKELKSKIGNSLQLFKENAFKYSQDKKLAQDSGYAGKLYISQLDSTEALAMMNLNINDITDPVRTGDPSNYSYTIIFIKDRIPEHKPTLESDYEIIQRIALNKKEAKMFSDWFDEIKKTIYVKIMDI